MGSYEYEMALARAKEAEKRKQPQQSAPKDDSFLSGFASFGNTLDSLGNMGAGIAEQAIDVAQMAGSPTGIQGALFGRAIDEAGKLIAHPIDRTSENLKSAIDMVPVLRTANQYAEDSISGQPRPSSEYGKMLNEDVVNAAVPFGMAKWAKRATRQSPYRAEELAASSRGVTESAMQKSVKEGLSFKQDQNGGLQSQTPIMDSYRKVEADGGFKTPNDPATRINAWDGKIEGLEQQLDPVIKAADVVLKSKQAKILPDYKIAQDFINAMDDADRSKPAAQAELDYHKQIHAEGPGTMEYLQTQKKGIYKDLSDRAYGKAEGVTPPWYEGLRKAIAADIKMALEDGSGYLDPALAGQLKNVNSTLGAYYEQRGLQTKLYGEQAGVSSLAPISDLGKVGKMQVPLVGALNGPTSKMIQSKIHQGAGALRGIDPNLAGATGTAAAMPGGDGRQQDLMSMFAPPAGQINMNAPLPRDWKLLRVTPGGMDKIAMLATQFGAALGDLTSMTDAQGNQLLAALTMQMPMAFERTPDNYKSIINNVIEDPMEQDMHKSAAKDLPASQRAMTIGALYDGNKYVPLNTQPPTPAPSPAPVDAFQALGRISAPTGQMSYNNTAESDTEKMLATLRASINYA